MTPWLDTHLIAAVLMPPSSLVIVLALGLLAYRRRPRLAWGLILLSTATLACLSTALVSSRLLKSLEISPPISVAQLRHAQAIVVLSGGMRPAAAEYGRDALNSLSLERLRYAVHLHRISGLPLLLTGGNPSGATLPEARILQHALRTDYGLHARWVEDASRTTWDNAHLSAPLLKADDIQHIALVTHAWHLRRAVPLFEAHGLHVTPAGTQFSRTDIDGLLDFVPAPAGLRDSTFALHEWLGILWYKLRTKLD
ncbi:MAG: YdcF family protein [Thiobacillus sp.]